MQSPDHSFVVPSISRDMRDQYETHFPFVWRYMAHRGVPQASMDDVVHSVFRIFREHPSRRDSSRPTNVVLCMISGQVLREWKKRNGQAEDVDAMSEGEGPTRMFSRDAATEMLHATLDELTETQVEVFLLCVGEKLPARDVADALNISESIVDSRLKSAQQRVAAVIERLRSLPLADSIRDLSPRGLMAAARKARTPTDADRERVFAAMLASSMASAPPPIALLSLPQQQRQHQQRRSVHDHAELAPASFRPQRASQPAPSAATQTLPPQRLYFGWSAVACVALVMGAATYIGLMARRGGSVVERDTMAAAPAEPAAPSPFSVEDVTDRVLPAQAPEPAPEAVAAEPAEEPAEEEPAAEPARERHESKRAKKSKRSRRHATPVPPRDDNRGARQLFAAERALHSGEPRVALDLVRAHAARYPDSELTTERNALRAQILCDLGRTRAARRVMLELEADHADQPLLASVDEACMVPAD